MSPADRAPFHFQKIAQKKGWANLDPRNVEKSRKWYEDAAGSLAKASPSMIMNTGKDWMGPTVSAESIGRMVMFFYDPKHKDRLPYYDTFPLVFPMEMYKDGFLGVNLHYVFPFVRARIMDELYSIGSDKNKGRIEKARLSYAMLKSVSSLERLKPCIKRYLFTHVRSKFLYIPPEFWDAAIFMPVERFKKANKNRVWMESSAAI